MVCVFPTNIIASAETKAVKKVFIAPGHGGRDPGAIANGYNEKDINLTISLACNEYLLQKGVSVQMSRYTDEDDYSKEA
ncbi:MAG: N-acetylmuramoyl-L-alanine amidase, partial [Clostridia bacterium]|nr:N-acetylmuramoyl-L-alanine amidase [Clostridia bacterium]